ncbi:MAG: DUF805 domain-containing protein [Pseudomonadota bacterium]
MSRFVNPFSFSGRISRRSFWKLMLVVIVPWLGIALANDISLLIGNGPLDALPRNWVWGIFLFTAWIACAAVVRRYHDRGRSAFWLIVPLAYAGWFAWDFILASEAARGTTPLILRELSETELRAAFESAKWTAIAWITGLAFLAAPALLMVIDLGLMPGKRDANRFGAPPAH